MSQSDADRDSSSTFPSQTEQVFFLNSLVTAAIEVGLDWLSFAQNYNSGLRLEPGRDGLTRG